MSQKAKNWAAVFAALALAAVVVFGMFIYAGVRNIEMPVVPTADEIASKIVIPPIVIPDTNNQQQQEIWDVLYEDEVNDLEQDAINACEREFDWDDIENLYDDRPDRDIEFESIDEDDYDITINNLGLNDEDDRKVTLDGFFIVSYVPEEGQQVRVNDKVYGTCVVTSEDNELEAELSFNL